ncbi:ROK family transcriptional regulator [Pedobacter sp.]|uniref:ROK family transcriptional regulator n=1 Tax=Pedobacter sp. TaxID=1411316 RepID=UPI003D7FC7B3
MTFFEELNDGNISGVAYKNIRLKKNIISHLCSFGNCTIADLCKELNISTPKVTSLVTELVNDGIVEELGKLDSTGGRKPFIYGMISNSAFFLGVDVKHTYINIGLADLQKNLVSLSENIPYRLNNDKNSLIELCELIKQFMSTAGVNKDKILGIGLNLTGRINYATGYSYSFFNFNEEPLTNFLEAELGIKAQLENDSRAMAYGEFNAGVVREEKDVLFLNIDYGLGMGVMIDSHLYYGKSGFAGEFGHIPLFNNEIICQCGKKGCLETEASGQALLRLFKQRVSEGSTTSLISQHKLNINDIILDDIIKAAKNDDVLSIELIAQIGEKLGRGIALLINIFNPELVIMGGNLAETGDYIRLPILSTINKYSLSLVSRDTQLKFSKLGRKAGVIGACLLVRKRLLEDTL